MPFMKEEGDLIASVEASIRNKWRWEWLDEWMMVGRDTSSSKKKFDDTEKHL